MISRPEEESAEIARLREENAHLRRLLGEASEPAAAPEDDEPQETWVLVTPDPTMEEEGRLSGAAISRLAQTTLGLLRDREPDVRWRAEHDLERIPLGSTCVRLGEVLLALWDGPGLPPFFEVEEVDGTRRLARRLIPAEPQSEAFGTVYDATLQMLDDLIAEAQAAHGAGAHHHAEWMLKACDLVQARLNLGSAYFDQVDPRWRATLNFDRPEYDPCCEVPASAPTGN